MSPDNHMETAEIFKQSVLPPSRLERLMSWVAGIFFRDYIEKMQRQQKFIQNLQAQLQKQHVEKQQLAKLEDQGKAQHKNLQELELRLRDEVTQAIEQRNEPKLVLFLKKGYEPTLAQYILLLFNADKFSSREVNDEIQKGIHEKLPVGIFRQLHKELQEANEEISRLVLAENKHLAYRKKVKLVENFSELAQTVWGLSGIYKALDSEEDIFLIWQSCRQALEVCQEKSFKSKMGDKEQFAGCLTIIISIIEKEKPHLLEKGLNEGLTVYSDLFNSFETVKNSILGDMVNNITTFKESDLPKDCQQLLQQIHSIHQEICIDKLSPQQRHEFETLYQKAMPQVLEEYITISPRYKEKLKKANEDPDKLLLQSLREVHEKLQAIADLHQDNNHHQLKVSSRYLKSL